MIKTYNMRAGKWLALIRLQSTPVTVVSLLLGYLTVNQTLDRHILPLIIVGALGHWGFYALNDVEDMSVDMAQGKEMKPLLSGEISKERAEVVSYTLIGLSILLSVVLFSPFAASAYLISSICGWYYDVHSSEHTYSSFYLGAWGVSIIWTGALYSQGWSVYTALISLLFGVHMIWMTVIGDLKDVENTEPNIPHRYGCVVTTLYAPEETYNGMARLFKPASFTAEVVFPLVFLQILISYSMSMITILSSQWSVLNLFNIIILLLSSFGFYKTAAELGDGIPFSTESITRDIVLNESFAVVMIIIASLSFISYVNAVILMFASVVWGLSVLRIQFGSFVRFP